ncbi:peptidase [Polymorphobacter glacialis]|uniref:Peptidase n=1 Tax=Sandarakinorhabdus glacialis TaxID=1614636 RepID=A0A916ZP37_9SPHN|nr:M12 family metallopeptidase [Polymorphobacter glacialis]GGE05771.1 peptidase [Polymorphobacter glacialis]
MCSEGFMESDDIRTTWIKPHGSAWKQVRYANVDGLAVFEGCIILGTTDEIEKSTAAFAKNLKSMPKLLESSDVHLEGAGIKGEQYRWKNRIVPYEIAAGLPNPARVTAAIDHWNARTGIRFVPRTNQPDWLRFKTDPRGCASQVGRQGGVQDIILMDNCTTGNIIHEIGHAVGLWHEQCRIDRDKWVRIDTDNARPGTEHNFEQQIVKTIDVGFYDYGSIMHYPANAFAVTPGSRTIIPLKPVPPGVVMGQRDALSAGDIAAVEALYAGVPKASLSG